MLSIRSALPAMPMMAGLSAIHLGGARTAAGAAALLIATGTGATRRDGCESEETLFGDTALVRERGRIGTIGRRRLDLFERRAQASEVLELWLGRKVRRGYRRSTAP